VIHLTYYTDPLCSWSWAFEPVWRRLRYVYRGQVTWRYCLGGLIADWSSFADPLHSISRPAQLGPHWYHVRQLSGVPIDGRIWDVDPPESSYPSCIAVKAARRQGAAVEEAFLRRVREAVMLERQNIARSDTLLALAEEISRSPRPLASFNLAKFRDDFGGGAIDDFREDLMTARYREIGRFPSLVVEGGSGPSLLVVGYRPFDNLQAALAAADGTIEPGAPPDSVISYVKYWGSVLGVDVAEAIGLDQAAVVAALDDLVRQGQLRRDERPHAATARYVTLPENT
jgi:predicted DsbA family dithiol-disulfide isomerase